MERYSKQAAVPQEAGGVIDRWDAGRTWGIDIVFEHTKAARSAKISDVYMEARVGGEISGREEDDS